jgi:hypothetical protein
MRQRCDAADTSGQVEAVANIITMIEVDMLEKITFVLY